MTKTVISEMSFMFESTIKMVSSFRNIDLAFYAEDLVYSEEIKKVIIELETELIKAKKIKDGN